MTVMPLIMDLAEQGIFPYVNGNKVVMTPAAKLTDALRLQVRNNKPALMSGLVELQQLAGPDWAACEANLAQLKAFAELVMISELRVAGQVPAHYTATVHCETCNQDVPHFPINGMPAWRSMNVSTVMACVWCINGLTAPPIPSR